MAKKIIAGIIAALMLIPIAIVVTSFGKQSGVTGVSAAKEFYNSNVTQVAPCTKPDGSPFTMAYVDIDPYPASGEAFYFFVEQMANEGWIKLPGSLPFDSNDTDAKELADYLADLDLGPYIRFSHDANYYTAVDDHDKICSSLLEHVANKDIDLIFCNGTSPAELVIHELGITDIPVMVYFCADPVGAGLSQSDEYSGQDNVWCHTSSGIYASQLKYYYDSFNFNKIGFVYYSESVGVMGQYRDTVRTLGRRMAERQIQTYTTANFATEEDYYKMLEETFTDLAVNERIDAFMLGTDIIKNVDYIEPLLKIFIEKKIPVFVQNGDYYVDYGALLSVTSTDAKLTAPFAVDAMGQILNGNKPGDVYQKFIISPYISVNVDTAKKIGRAVNQELLLAAEKIVTTAENED